MMTSKDFIALADTIRRSNQAAMDDPKVFGDKPVFDFYAICSLATFCKEQNPRFKRDVFIGYIAGTCGPSGRKVK